MGGRRASVAARVRVAIPAVRGPLHAQRRTPRPPGVFSGRARRWVPGWLYMLARFGMS